MESLSDCLVCRLPMISQRKKISTCCKIRYSHRKCYFNWRKKGTGLCPNCGKTQNKHRREEYLTELLKDDYIIPTTGLEPSFQERIDFLENQIEQLNRLGDLLRDRF